jgi:Na+/H+ antiporter NhaC
VISGTAQPLADYESTGLSPDEDTPQRWWNAALPVVSVVVVTLVGLYVSGTSSLAADGEHDPSLSAVIGASDPFTVLLWASAIGVVLAIALAVGQGALSLRLSLEAMMAGFKSMLMAVVVLTLAWSLGHVCTDMDTAGFLVAAVGPHLPTMLLPAAVFLVAAAVSFATGTSWGTMAILTPLAVPLVLGVEGASANLIAATVAAILGGAVFGDHCSPISDTTILSSMASSCDHVDHVRTQLPYALLGGVLAVLAGYIPAAAFGISPWILLVFGIILVVGWTFMVGKSPETEEKGPSQL